MVMGPMGAHDRTSSGVHRQKLFNMIGVRLGKQQLQEGVTLAGASKDKGRQRETHLFGSVAGVVKAFIVFSSTPKKVKKIAATDVSPRQDLFPENKHGEDCAPKLTPKCK